MAYDEIRRYKYWYARLVRLHPRSFYERYAEGMEQTFGDILRERVEEGRELFGYSLWVYVETTAGILRENTIYMITHKRTLTFVVGAVSLLLVPLFAMIFKVDGWDWKLPDFMIMAVLLSGVGIALAAATNASILLRNRLIGAGSVLFLILLYVHMAVGIVDTWPLAGS